MMLWLKRRAEQIYQAASGVASNERRNVAASAVQGDALLVEGGQNEMMGLPPRHWLFLALVIVLHVTPLWLVTYLPSTDGPAHMYIAQVLMVMAPAVAPLMTISRQIGICIQIFSFNLLRSLCLKF